MSIDVSRAFSGSSAVFLRLRVDQTGATTTTVTLRYRLNVERPSGTGFYALAGSGNSWSIITGTPTDAEDSNFTYDFRNPPTSGPRSVLIADVSRTINVSGVTTRTVRASASQPQTGSIGSASIPNQTMTLTPTTTTAAPTAAPTTPRPTTTTTTTTTTTAAPVAVFSDSSLATAAYLGRLYENTSAGNNTVVATNVSSFAVVDPSPAVSGAQSLLPTGLSGIRSVGTFVISGTPTALGKFAFRIQATNSAGVTTTTSNIEIDVLPPIKRMTGLSSNTQVNTFKRFIGIGQVTTNAQGQQISADSQGYVNVSRIQRFNGSSWVNEIPLP